MPRDRDGVKERQMFSGSIPALVTPFRDGRFDETAFRSFVDWQIEQGSSALVPCGTTGESATMSIAEHDKVVAVCVEQAGGRVPVIAGCGSNDTLVALDHMRSAHAAGANAALVVLPYYNRPNQEGVYAHFAYLADHCDLPIIVYNVPGRTVTDILPETLGRLAKISSIVGIKDASGKVERVTAQRLACGEDFCQLSGNDDMALGMMAMGGAGCISVTANVAPKLCADFQKACLEGRWIEALALQDRLFPLHTALFSDASPGPVKYALNKVRSGFPADLRLPMTPAGEASRKAVDAAMKVAGLV
jgi:4-hydroxy-tetrahydrodipicolinate synthase